MYQQYSTRVNVLIKPKLAFVHICKYFYVPKQHAQKSHFVCQNDLEFDKNNLALSTCFKKHSSEMFCLLLVLFYAGLFHLNYVRIFLCQNGYHNTRKTKSRTEANLCKIKYQVQVQLASLFLSHTFYINIDVNWIYFMHKQQYFVVMMYTKWVCSCRCHQMLYQYIYIVTSLNYGPRKQEALYQFPYVCWFKLQCLESTIRLDFVYLYFLKDREISQPQLVIRQYQKLV
eukprot:TRINITY_DN10621_c2_g1_i3.p1 TRINITY_DN10621_c2_g1~~TRINITY_DN10621_c2_g1_i3.p1  ORF type:complete len:229 (-),score=-10.00 TRINITY_DN10621_c2_g1_i3:283-969(-)